MRRLFRFGLKAGRARIVQQIERGVVPGNLAEARLDGDLAVVLLRVVVHGRRAGRDGPHLRNRPARAEKRLDQRRLSGSPVRKDSNIADRLRFGFLHKRSLQGKRGGILGGDAWSVNRAAPAHAVRTPPRSAKLGRQRKQAAQPQGQSSSALTLATVLPASSPMASRTVTGVAVPT